MNKTERVMLYLKEHGSITSWEAIQLFRATRLSDIIFRLRNSGMNIDTLMIKDKTADGYNMPYAKYILRENNNDNKI